MKRTNPLVDPEVLTNPDHAVHDISALISRVKSEATWKNRDRHAVTLTRTPGLHITLIAMHAETSKPWHRVECPISIQVIEGRIDFITDTETKLLKQGDILILPPGIRHHMKVLDESVILLTLGATIGSGTP
jgi:quercetin dioxygenase-like cupin family protein